MGSCYSAVEPEKHVLILGLDNAGKTTVLRRLLRSDEKNPESRGVTIDEVTAVSPTQGFNNCILRKDGTKITFTDVGGAKSMRHAWRKFYDKTDFLLYIVDSTDRRRMEETGDELLQILDENKLAGLPLLIFANKCDVIKSLTTDQLKAALNMHMRDRNWAVISSSGKTGAGIEEGIKFLMTATKVIQ